MRELKLRIWDTKNKHFLSQSSEYYHFGDVTGIPYTLNEILNKLDRFVVQQFTGLYDKNKKPIYEGDRVRSSYTGNVDFYSEVVWLEDRASFGVISKNSFETFEDLMDYMKFFEVVGNIFQLPCNPDHNGECLVCDCWLSDCEFLNKENKD